MHATGLKMKATVELKQMSKGYLHVDFGAKADTKTTNNSTSYTKFEHGVEQAIGLWNSTIGAHVEQSGDKGERHCLF